MTTLTLTSPRLKSIGRHALRLAKTSRVRSLREFAEQEIVIPTGKYEGDRFRVDRQPFTGLWLDAWDSGQWWEMWAMGPSQSSKTLVCLLIPLVYVLCELKETVVIGVPKGDIAKEKWEQDIVPILERTRYRDILPRSGSGSKGGFNTFIRLANRAAIKFMSAGGDDKTRAHFSSRWVFVTEVNAMCERQEVSDESNKLEQIIARTKSHETSRARIIGECTITTPDFGIAQRVKDGTNSQVAVQCPHCKDWILPTGTPKDRQLIGLWQDAKSKFEALRNARYVCWHCGEAWSEKERYEANKQAKLVHDGQRLEHDRVVGEAKDTYSLGFRWTGIHNMLRGPGDIAKDEWANLHETNDELKEERERSILQFDLCVGYTPPNLTVRQLTDVEVQRRTAGVGRGQIPADCDCVVAAVDTGRHLCYYVVLAVRRSDFRAHVIDYNSFEVAFDALQSDEKAIDIALREFGETLEQGYLRQDGKSLAPHLVLVDSGFAEHQKAIYRFCRQRMLPDGSWPWVPSKGFGVGQYQTTQRIYHQAMKVGGNVKRIGDQWQLKWMPDDAVHLVEMDADAWKGRVQKRLMAATDSPGAITLFTSANQNEHLKFGKHMTAEQEQEEFLPGRGMVRKWVAVKKGNHYFDAMYGSLVAASIMGARMGPEIDQGNDGAQETAAVTMPDGRPFFTLAR